MGLQLRARLLIPAPVVQTSWTGRGRCAIIAADRFNTRAAPGRPTVRAMADIDVQQKSSLEPEDDYTYAEIIYWIVGILSIPLVPIIMGWLFTPWSGM